MATAQGGVMDTPTHTHTHTSDRFTLFVVFVALSCDNLRTPSVFLSVNRSDVVHSVIRPNVARTVTNP